MTTEQVLAENQRLTAQLTEATATIQRLDTGNALQTIASLESELAQLRGQVADLTSKLSMANETANKRFDESEIIKRTASKLCELGISSVGIPHPGHSIVAGDLTAQELWAMPADQRREFIKNYKKQS
jgi:hypothetical protein